MDLSIELLKEHSKEKTQEICDHLIENPLKIKDLIKIITGKDPILVQRGTWVLGTLGETNPSLFAPFINKILKQLPNHPIDAYKRNTLRFLLFAELPANQLGFLTDTCINFILNQKEAVGIRSFAIKICSKICLLEPDLTSELLMVINSILPHTSAGINSASRQMRKELRISQKEDF